MTTNLMAKGQLQRGKGSLVRDLPEAVIVISVVKKDIQHVNVESVNEEVRKKRKENQANTAKEKVHLKVAKEIETRARNVDIVLETKNMKS